MYLHLIVLQLTGLVKNGMPKKSNNYYCVYGCKSYYRTDDSISFHRLPMLYEPKVLWRNNKEFEELVDCRRIWAILLKLSKEALTKKQILICSKHFTKEDFFPLGKILKTINLKLYVDI